VGPRWLGQGDENCAGEGTVPLVEQQDLVHDKVPIGHCQIGSIDEYLRDEKQAGGGEEGLNITFKHA